MASGIEMFAFPMGLYVCVTVCQGTAPQIWHQEPSNHATLKRCAATARQSEQLESALSNEFYDAAARWR